MKRIPTQIKGFDWLIEGGFPEGSITLVSGTPGTGKSIFCMQFLVNCAKRGEKSLYISFEETEDSLKGTAKSFGWLTEELEKKGTLRIIYINLRKEGKETENILSQIKKEGYARIVVDSLSNLAAYPIFVDSKHLPWAQMQNSLNPVALETEYVTRMQIQELIDKLRETKATTLLTSELLEGAEGLSRDTVSEFACDGVIVLYYITIGSESFGNLQVRKMRRTKHKQGLFPTKITDKGIEIGSEETMSIR